MNQKAMQLAISTLILIVLGIFVLIALILFLTGGFEKFKDTTTIFLDSEDAQIIKLSCENACNQNLKIIYCCEKYDLKEQEISCADSRLEVECDINCTNFECEVE